MRLWTSVQHADHHGAAVGGLLLCTLLLVVAPNMASGLAADQPKVPLVALRDIAPSIAIDMRYATPNNFTGAPVDGYGAAECLLRRPVAEALARVASELTRHDPPLGLLIYDCYRPERAVRAFANWAERPEKGSKPYHPRIGKTQLFARGYIASRSGHSRGTAVDLTLVPLAAAMQLGEPSAGPGPDCTAPKAERPDDVGVDMGTGFDCFDVRSHTKSADVTAEQRRWRQTLKSAMERQGFENYTREWWHFSYPAADDGRSFDVPIMPRASNDGSQPR